MHEREHNATLKDNSSTVSPSPGAHPLIATAVATMLLAAGSIGGFLFYSQYTEKKETVSQESAPHQHAGAPDFGSLEERESVYARTDPRGRSDRLWHAWEELHFGCTRCVNRFGDGDDDTLLNIFEFLFMSNPFSLDSNDNGVSDVDDLLQGIHPADGTRALSPLEQQKVAAYIDPLTKREGSVSRSSAISREIEIPSDSSTLELIYYFSGTATSTDYITIFFNNEHLATLDPRPLVQFDPSDARREGLRSVLIPVTHLQEQVGNLTIVFNSEGVSGDSDFLIGDLSFLTSEGETEKILTAQLQRVSSPGWETSSISTVPPQDIPLEIDGKERTGIQLATRTETDLSGIFTNIVIPVEADGFQFNFRITKAGDEDWITVSFDGQLLWSMSTKKRYELYRYSQAEFHDAFVTVEHIAGQTGELEIILHGSGKQEAEIALTNFYFVSFGR